LSPITPKKKHRSNLQFLLYSMLTKNTLTIPLISALIIKKHKATTSPVLSSSPLLLQWVPSLPLHCHKALHQTIKSMRRFARGSKGKTHTHAIE